MKKISKKSGNKVGWLKRIQELRSQVHPETEQSVWGVVFIGLAAIFILAVFQKAGPAGALLYNSLTKMFGLGYYLFPAIFLLMTIAFFSAREQKAKGVAVTFISAAFFIFAGLGLIDILYPDRGGWAGRLIGELEKPFGFTSAIVISATVLLATLILTLNLPVKFRKPKEEKKLEPLIIKNPEVLPAVSKTEEKTEIEEPAKAPEMNPPAGGENPKAFFVPRKRAFSAAAGKNYVAPPLTLLKSSVEKPTAGDLRANANIIKRTLESFGVAVEMGEISIGPKVTRYTLKPAEGVKLSRITALNQDLALALASHPIRIEAPIPGKSLVGIEVPNKSAAIVRLGSLMAFPEFTDSGPLSFILGRDVSGEPVFADIEKMPHLLIAGSTGSGKSVAIHALLVSLLYKNSPETLKLVLIDPKRVELTIYNQVPHLVAPVITDGKKALGVFRWAIQEMEQRYEKLQTAGARDIRSYNKTNPKELLPYLVVVVDELADLMAAYGRDIESSIVRLAQMARATGIHLVLSTQRPSVEVITGLIKANITSRMALQVASQVDSRTILDSAGAEKLLGGGDMLFVSSELSKSKRIQGAYLTEEELHNVTDFIRENNSSLLADGSEPDFDKNPSAGHEELNFEHYAGDEDDDELYDRAVLVVREAQKASASLLQRRLAVGYARAARLLDLMEEKGLIGPGEGAKPREVYLEKEDTL